MSTLDALAERLDVAQISRTAVPSLSDGLDIGDAYAVQSAVLARRTARGERLTGVKLGFTSKAKMAQTGVSEVILGRLTDAMRVDDGADVDLSRFIHPRIEPEIAFRLSRDVEPDDLTADIESCVDGVAPALEIIDSRYRDFRFTHVDVVADNTSAAGYVIGTWHPVQDLTNRAVRLLSGRTELVGSTSAILGAPVRALHALRAVCRNSSGPTASNAALPYSPATIGSATFSAGVTALANINNRRWPQHFERGPGEREVPDAEQETEDRGVHRRRDERPTHTGTPNRRPRLNTLPNPNKKVSPTTEAMIAVTARTTRSAVSPSIRPFIAHHAVRPRRSCSQAPTCRSDAWTKRGAERCFGRAATGRGPFCCSDRVSGQRDTAHGAPRFVVVVDLQTE